MKRKWLTTLLVHWACRQGYSATTDFDSLFLRHFISVFVHRMRSRVPPSRKDPHVALLGTLVERLWRDKSYRDELVGALERASVEMGMV